MYVMSYFKTSAEALHLAISDDGFTWTPLNKGEAMLQSIVSAKSIRDPFIIQSKNGRFELLWTDDLVSKYLVHCYSDDLLNWSQQKAVPVMVDIPTTTNTWAPEAFYDREEQLYRIIWASTTREGAEPAKDDRIWSCTTRDFETFSKSSLFFDPGYRCIDATVGYLNGEYLMAFKDARGTKRLDTPYKRIRICTSRRGCGPFENISDTLNTPPNVEGPTLFRRNDQWIMFYDFYMDDDVYMGSASKDGRNWHDITKQVTFPPKTRHCTVIEIDDAIGKKLRSKIQAF